MCSELASADLVTARLNAEFSLLVKPCEDGFAHPNIGRSFSLINFAWKNFFALCAINSVEWRA